MRSCRSMTVWRPCSVIWFHEHAGAEAVIWLRQTIEAARQALILQSRGRMTWVLGFLGLAVGCLSFFLPGFLSALPFAMSLP